jgi:glycosyltransferase involved in cell wall biosynthesis
MDPVASVVIGPRGHGVVRHATLLAQRTGVRLDRRSRPPHDLRPASEHGECVAGAIAPAAVYHWHFTDRLFGPNVEAAADRLVDAIRALGGRHVISLHDVPAPRSTARSIRRVAAYRRLTATADATVVASEHERSRLARGGADHCVDVIPLPIVETPTPASRSGECARRVGVLGYIYPGKGHAEVIAAAAPLPADVRLWFLGRPSDGHAALVTELRRAAAAQPRDLAVTGYLPDEQLQQAMRRVDVPVVPARAMSASASVATWIGAGRRPLVARNGYSTELAAHGNGLITLYEPDDLTASLRCAVDDPSVTYRDEPLPRCLGIDAVADAHRQLYRRLLA